MAKFIKKKDEWHYISNGHIAIIEKRGYYYYATAYVIIGNERRIKFNFPRQHLLKDMKCQILNNSLFKFPIKKIKPEPLFKSRQIEGANMWWLD